MSIRDYFESIALAIKDKNENITTVTPSDMPTAIRDITTGVEIINQTEWDALTTEEKKQYELIAIQDSDSGFNRGILAYGRDLEPLLIAQGGRKAQSNSTYDLYTATNTATITIYVLLLNGEASSKNQNITLYCNDTELTLTSNNYKDYTRGTDNTRNYRIVSATVEVTTDDIIRVAVGETSNYTMLSYYIINYADNYTNLDTAKTSDGQSVNLTLDFNGIVLYGYINGQQNVYNNN